MVLALAVQAAAPRAGAAPVGAAPVGDDAAVIDAFQRICLGHPTLAQIDARAAAMGLKVGDNQAVPSANHEMTRHKTWSGTLKIGPFGLMLDAVTSPSAVSVGCTVLGAAVADPEVFRGEITQALNLPPSAPPRLEGASRSFEWTNVAGPGTTLVVRDLSPAGKPGIIVKLLSRTAQPPG
jgi:hypothetical protein